MIASDLGVWENSGPGGVVPQRWVLRISKDKQVREVKRAMTWVPRAPCPCLCPGPVGYMAVPVSSSPFLPLPLPLCPPSPCSGVGSLSQFLPRHCRRGSPCRWGGGGGGVGVGVHVLPSGFTSLAASLRERPSVLPWGSTS